MDDTPRVFLAMPHHADVVHYKAAQSFHLEATEGACRYRCYAIQTSLLARGMNVLWAQALELADRGEFTHFAMLHSDIAAEKGWLDKLMAEMEKHDAQVMSAVSPLKDGRGLTSTGVGEPDPWGPVRRLTMAEVGQLPETFGRADVTEELDQVLLVNTGCMLVDVRGGWCRETNGENGDALVYFTIKDRVVREGDRWMVKVRPEDWNFSRMAARQGARVMATQAVKLEHLGGFAYPNHLAWGSWDTDRPGDETQDKGVTK